MNQRALKRFFSLPVNPNEVWQGGVVSVADALGIPPAEDADKMAMVLWRSGSSKLVHAEPISLTDENRLKNFVKAMLEFNRAYEFPFRPARIECNDRDLADGLSDLMPDSRTIATFAARMPEWDNALQDLTNHIGEPSFGIASTMST